jgi:hypothetical protein
MIEEMISHREPYWVISPAFVLLKVEKSDISWAGKSFKSDNVTYLVTTSWTVEGKRYQLESVATGWISRGDDDVDELVHSWTTDEPDETYSEIMTFVGRSITESLRKEPTIEEIGRELEEEGMLLLEPKV